MLFSLIIISGISQSAYGQSIADNPLNNDPVEFLINSESVNMGGNPIVYENGVEDPGNNGFLMHGNSVAEDFVLVQNEIITDVHFVLLEFEGVYNDEPIEYAILGDNSGVPDPSNVLASGDSQNLGSMQLGTGPFGDRIMVWFDLRRRGLAQMACDALDRYPIIQPFEFSFDLKLGVFENGLSPDNS